MLLPVLVKGKLKAQGLQCLANHRQLTFAWKMYTDDHNDLLLYASHHGVPIPNLESVPWVTGDLDFNPANQANWDPELGVKNSPMWPYCGGSTAIWKCPADHSYVVVDGEQKPRVRSMSMNIWVGGFDGFDGNLSGGTVWPYGAFGGGAWRVYLKMSQFTTPGPAGIFLLMDMREDSIDWGNFATDMTGWPDNPAATSFYDLPASYHHRAGGLSFVDGHAEIKRWLDDRTMPQLVENGLVKDQFPSPNNPDILWLQERATRPK